MVGRRHNVIGISRGDALPNEGFSRISRDDSGSVFSVGKGTLLGVESKICFACSGIKAVTSEAMI